ncbi:MAG: hypothetical protein R3C11_02365 [Planctomycetaceae bacterium]
MSSLTASDLQKLTEENKEVIWSPIYSRVNGSLSMSDLQQGSTSFLTSRFDVGSAGEVRLNFNSVAGLELWVDGKPVSNLGAETLIDVSTGEHTLTFKIDRAERGDEPLRLEFSSAPNSPARPNVINGI